MCSLGGSLISPGSMDLGRNPVQLSHEQHKDAQYGLALKYQAAPYILFIINWFNSISSPTGILEHYRTNIGGLLADT